MAHTHSNGEKQMIMLATIATEKQSDPEMQAVVLYAKSDDCRIKCGDCARLKLARTLDNSTGLCPICYEVAEWENDLQDGSIDEKQFNDIKAKMHYKGDA